MEYIDIITEDGAVTGEVKEKSEVHARGLWHRTVHIWFVNSKNEILLQRRSKEKENHPDMWDISAAGHISAGESPIIAALREIKEEIGVTLSDENLTLIGEITQKSVSNNGTYINNEISNVYLVSLEAKEDELVVQKEEVQFVQWIPFSEFKQWIVEKKPDLVSHPDEFKLLFEKI